MTGKQIGAWVKQRGSTAEEIVSFFFLCVDLSLLLTANESVCMVCIQSKVHPLSLDNNGLPQRTWSTQNMRMSTSLTVK